MKTKNQSKRTVNLVVATAVGLLSLLSMQAEVLAQSMTNYTNYPIFLSQTVPPNILFLVDMGNFTLEAAYSGTGHKYPISFKTGTATASLYASNVTVDSNSGDDLVAVSDAGVAFTAAQAPVTAPKDTFDSSKSYYGMFDPLRCYTTDSNSFNYASVKATVGRLGQYLLGRQFSQLADHAEERNDLSSTRRREADSSPSQCQRNSQ